MPSGPAILDAIERAAEAGAFSADVGAAIKQAVNACRAGERFDVALGLVGPGVRTVRTIIEADHRDDLLLAVAAFVPGGSARARALRIHRVLVGYQTSTWTRRDRSLTACPARYAGKIEAAMWTFLRAGDYVPSERSIRRLLGHEPPAYSWPTADAPIDSTDT